MNKYLIVCCCLIVWGLMACEDCVFTSENSTNVVIRFYQQKFDQNQKLVYDTLPIQFLTVNTSVNRTLLTNLSRRSTYSLRINPSADTTTIYFERIINNQVRKDTLTVSYQRKMYLVSPDCGYDEEISALKIRKCTFTYDSIAILFPNLTIKNVPNIQIYKK